MRRRFSATIIGIAGVGLAMAAAGSSQGTAEAPRAASTRPQDKPAGPVGVTTRVFHPETHPDSSQPGSPKAEPASSQPASLRNWRGASAHELRAVIWYPAVDTAIESQQFLLSPPSLGQQTALFDAGRAMAQAGIAPRLGQWPLLVLSHGSGGSALQMAWLGTELARAGYVVVAVDHPGNNSTEPMTPEGMALWWERATDLSNVLDAMLQDPQFGRLLDTTRIGAAGYSLGGYTVLQLAGARTDIDAYFALCKAHPDNAVCQTPALHGLGSPAAVLEAVRHTSGESLARSADSFRDPRIKAVFAIAPALGFTQTPESLRAIKIPVELIAGADDRTAPPADNADYLRANIHGARETVLPGVTHYVFLNVCTPAGRQALPQYCTDPASVNRAAIHAQVAAQAAQFFDRALRVR